MIANGSFVGRVDVLRCYTDDTGIPQASLQKRQRKLLERCRPLLEPVLEPDERLWYVAEAIAPYSLLELLTTGWIITVLKRCLLVVTDRRILHLPADARWRPKRSIAEVRYADLRSIEVKGMLQKQLRLVYGGGKKESFGLLRRAAYRRLRTLLANPPGRADGTPEGGRGFLCPRCASRLPRYATRCAACSLAFRDRRRATFWSLVVPGGGYFYTGHPVLGSLDCFVETGLLLMFVLTLLVVPSDPEALPAAAMLFALLAVEKAITIYHARHYVAEFLPAES